MSSLLQFDVPPFPTWIKGGRCQFAPGTRHFSHRCEVFDMLYVLRGCLYIKEAGTPYELSAGQYLMLVPEWEHGGHLPCKEETEFIWLHFAVPNGYELTDSTKVTWSDVLRADSSYTSPARYQFQVPRHAAVHASDRIEAIMLNLLEWNGAYTPDAALRQQLLFSEFWIQLQKKAIDIPSTTEQVAENIIAYIHQHYREPLNMTRISKDLLFHPDYLTRCMQQATGKTPLTYLNQYRLSIAKQLLATTNATIAEISRQVGIVDSTYFSKLYRKYEGVTPLEFRRASLSAHRG